MVFFQLIGAAVEFSAAQLVRTRLGLVGLALLTLLLVGIRAGHPRLVGWTAFALLLLTLQLQV